VTACVPASLSLIFEARLLETMTLALPDEDGSHAPAGVQALLEAAAGRGSAFSALALGPGLGRGESAQAFIRAVLEAVELPVVLDADGLNAYAGEIDSLRGRAAVLTPHEGELERLLGEGGIAGARLRRAREAAERAQAVVVLKGDDTLVADPDGRVAVSPGATPALATAGTGDVLTGVTAAMLAKELDPFTAACAAVRLHALAAIRAADAHGVEGVIASDVIAELAAVRRR
jgi:NAD(P)H-hydrate epimerase